MSYPDSVRYLYALGNELKAGAKFGLERMTALLAKLGNPERDQSLIHVAGTNGKGSTSAMIASILQQAGRSTGLYTSPHLIEPTERIQVNGKAVSAPEFAAAFEKVHAAAEQLLLEQAIDAHPSYFETVTAMALLIFQRTTESSVIEVGLGGRLDATNVIAPRLCVITPVSYDHEAFLGNTLESIAAEKAGILKTGIPAVVAPQGAVAEQVIADHARQLGCRVLHAAGVNTEVVRVSVLGSAFKVNGAEFECSLPGRHQIENATTAILACRELGIDENSIQRGLRKARWPGRLERVASDPDFVLDGAHNPAGAKALASYIREFASDRPVWIVYGAMRDKAIEEVTEHLFPLAERLILTAPKFPRALRPEIVREITAHPNATVTEGVQEAITAAREAPREAVVFFTGSLYLVGEVRQYLLDSGSFVE